MALPSNVYPSRLREFREAAFLTRAALAVMCERLEAVDAARYTAVGVSTIKYLERGASQPRPTTAMTLAAVLEQKVSDVFPNGIDTKNRLIDK